MPTRCFPKTAWTAPGQSSAAGNAACSQHATLLNLLPALLLSWLAGTLILLGGRQLARLLGHRALNAPEALMGLLLTAIAVGMLVHGLHELYGIGPA